MQQLLGWQVPGLVEKDVSSLWRLLYVCCQPIEVFDCGGVDFVHNVVVEDEPESMGLHDWDVMASEKTNLYKTPISLHLCNCAIQILLKQTCWGLNHSVSLQPPNRTWLNPLWLHFDENWPCFNVILSFNSLNESSFCTLLKARQVFGASQSLTSHCVTLLCWLLFHRLKKRWSNKESRHSHSIWVNCIIWRVEKAKL